MRALLLFGLGLGLVEILVYGRVYSILAQQSSTGQALLTIVLSQILMAMVGIKIVRAQGVRMMLDTQKNLAQGRLPDAQLLDHLLVALGGIALALPGYASDILGLAVVLVPWIRRRCAKILSLRMQTSFQRTRVHTYQHGGAWERAPTRPEVIDVEAVDRQDMPHLRGDP